MAAQTADDVEQQLEAVRQQQAIYLQQQGGLAAQAALSTQGLTDTEVQIAKLRAEVGASQRRLEETMTRLTALKQERAQAMQASYISAKDSSFFYALVDSRSLSEFLSKGQYTDFLLDKRAHNVEEIDRLIKDLDRQRRDTVTRKNALEVEIAALTARLAEIRGAQEANRENLEAANRLEALLAGSIGNFNRNDRSFLKNNEPIGDLITFEGGGTDHGLGLSQYGAKGAADRGKNYKEILSHYYPGTAIGQVGTFATNVDADSERYLVGVVEAEMSSHWPAEALKAQAVAARSYAYNNRNGLDNSPRTQAWVGPDLQTEAARRAVAETRGQVVTFQGEVVAAYFHSTSGGWTENNENVWGGSPLLWLRGVPSPWETDSPHWDWKTKSYSRSQMQDILNRDGRTAVGELRTIKIVGRGVSGRVTSMQLIGSSGIKTVSGARFKSVFNNYSPPGDPVLRSTMFGFI